jgi:serine/threonine protein kinase
LKKNKLKENKDADELTNIPDYLLDNYEIGSLIGRGHYALVRECKDINTGFKFALKEIDLTKYTSKVGEFFLRLSAQS